MWKRALIPLLAPLLLGVGAVSDPAPLDLATTTSVRDSGLLDELLAEFTRESRIRVRVIAVGTGAALRMGADGNADVLLTHAPDAERELVDAGALASRRPFMENHFVVAGPPEDPARVGDAPSAVQGFRRLAAADAPYVSRGDDSGTHKREVALLSEAGLDPVQGWSALVRTGSGMGLTLQVAGERRAYVLSDLGTFLAFRDRIGLVSLSRPEPALRNVYSILQVGSGRLEPAAARGARALESFLLSPRGQQLIAGYGRERFGRPLFRPLHPTE